MKKVFQFCAITFLLLLFCGLSCNKAQAADLGKGFTLDGFATVGKLWDVDFNDTDLTRTIDITTNKGRDRREIFDVQGFRQVSVSRWSNER